MKVKEIKKLLRIYVPSKTLLGNNRAKLITEIQKLALRQKWNYAKQKIKERDEQWKSLVRPFGFTTHKLFEKLSESEFE